MSGLSCSFCGRRKKRARLPRGWRVHGDSVLCTQCRRERYRLRSITMQIVESTGAAWQELGTAPGDSWRRARLRDGTWEARVAEGRPVVRVLIGDRWWDLRLKSASWYGGKRAAYEKARIRRGWRGTLGLSYAGKGPHPTLRNHVPHGGMAVPRADGELARAARRITDRSNQLDDVDIADLRRGRCEPGAEPNLPAADRFALPHFNVYAAGMSGAAATC